MYLVNRNITQKKIKMNKLYYKFIIIGVTHKRSGFERTRIGNSVPKRDRFVSTKIEIIQYLQRELEAVVFFFFIPVLTQNAHFSTWIP